MKFIHYLFVSTLFFAVCASASAQGSHFVLLGNGESLSPEKKFVRPLTAPFLHEDAFITTDVRGWFLFHENGESNSLSEISGDQFEVTTLQARLAVTETLQAILYKNGYSDLNDSDGWNDIGVGLKLGLFQDAGSQLYISIGAGYEISTGDDQVFQDTDEYRVFASVNKGFNRLHLGANANYIATDRNNANDTGNADMLTIHLHADFYVHQWFSPVVELNGYFVQDANSSVTNIDFSGVDLVSINGGERNDTITYAFGFESRPIDESFGLRAAYETQLNNSEDSLFGYRWTLSAVYEF